jgi:hypothetical protein
LTFTVPLFLQALATFNVIQSVIMHVPLYFAQRQPKELGNFAWVVDGEDQDKVTEWETWWPWYACGALSTRSRSDAMPVLEDADYSYFERFNYIDGAAEGTDLNLLLADLGFRRSSRRALSSLTFLPTLSAAPWSVICSTRDGATFADL